jgi:hypothetical protein
MMYGLRAAAAALLFALLATSGPAVQTASAQDCATIESITAQIRSEAPDIEIRVVSGPLAVRLRAGIANLIGQDVPEGGSYLIAHAPTVLTSYVVRFADGCATHHGRFPDRLLRAWLDGSPA